MNVRLSMTTILEVEAMHPITEVTRKDVREHSLSLGLRPTAKLISVNPLPGEVQAAFDCVAPTRSSLIPAIRFTAPVRRVCQMFEVLLLIICLSESSVNSNVKNFPNTPALSFIS
ncbi:hypothetical protein SAMN05518855_10175 [Paenibacillus sp. CF384]|nr:hypothetical protein SAMN05518855_10175 [Paenibacillus sp. CF384]